MTASRRERCGGVSAEFDGGLLLMIQKLRLLEREGEVEMRGGRGGRRKREGESACRLVVSDESCGVLGRRIDRRRELRSSRGAETRKRRGERGKRESFIVATGVLERGATLDRCSARLLLL